MERIKTVVGLPLWVIFITIFSFTGLTWVPGITLAESVPGDPAFEIGDGVIPPSLGYGDILGSEEPGPDWEDIFTADGKLRDDYNEFGDPGSNGVPDYMELDGGRWAVFIADDVSALAGLDLTALAGSDRLVHNAAVDADQDIGNAYVTLDFDGSGDTVIFGGAERLGPGDGYLEFEFNRAHVRLGHGGYSRGEPWEVVGDRASGDLLLRLSFAGGFLASAEVSKWTEGGAGGGSFQSLEILPGEDCNPSGTVCVSCNGFSIDAGPWSNADPQGDPALISPHRFVEFKLNVGALLGSQPDYTSISVRTSQDVAYGYFAEGN